jgi:hypothetical protein
VTVHQAVYQYLGSHLADRYGSVLEFGSRNVNGSPRDIIDADRWVGVDISDGPGVDVVADAATVNVPGLFELVVCVEVFEHATDDQCVGMCANAARHLERGGMFVATMAGMQRLPHSAVDGGMLRPDEFYRNVSHSLLDSWLQGAGFSRWTIDEQGEDIRCVAVKA